MALRQNINEGSAQQLADELLEIKELIYYALCRPDEFRKWVETALHAEDQKTLQDISRQLRQAALFDLTVANGEDVNSLRSDIFYLELAVTRELKIYRELVNQIPETDEHIRDCRQKLINTVEGLDNVLLRFANTMAKPKNNAEWRGLAPSIQNVLRMLLICLTDTISTQDKIMTRLGECELSTPSLLELRHQQSQLNMKMNALINVQITSERMATNLDRLHRLQNIATKLMGDVSEQQRGKIKFIEMFEFNKLYVQKLSDEMCRLRDFQGKFKAYLESGELLLPAVSADTRDEIDMNEWLFRKRQAAALHAKRVQHDMQVAKVSLFQERQSTEKIFQHACECYDKRDFKAALSGFLSCVKNMHAASFAKVGEMLVNGEACDKDLGLARYYFWVAYGLEDNPNIAFEYCNQALNADKQAAAFIGCIETADNEANNQAVEDAVIEEAALRDWVLRSQVSVLDRLFRFGKLLMCMLAARNRDIRHSNESILKIALDFFEWAYKYSNDQCGRKQNMRAVTRLEADNLLRALNQAISDLELIKSEIVSYLDAVEENALLAELKPLIADFYRRNPIKPEAVSAEVLSARSFI